MSTRDEPGPGAETPGERTSILSAAILRISASLDLGTVLREVVMSARALTGARNGIIAAVDEAGRPQEFVMSGLTPDEERGMTGWLPDGLRLFEHLRELEAPLRCDDFPAYVRALGFSPDLIPCTSLQGTPMRHRGVHVGSFFLGDKQGAGGFTDEDEALLVLFASQAAAAIVNARTHRAERRARADLEALVETSPVGVIVLDAASGTPLSINREATRILGALLGPERGLADLREAMTARLADGREVTHLRFRDVCRREELGGNVEIRHPCERLRRPAAGIGSLARGNPYTVSRRIAPTTALRASARACRNTCYRAAFGGSRSAHGRSARNRVQYRVIRRMYLIIIG